MKNNNPLISVITASYNYEKYLPEAIESILSQSYLNWELIIIDDGSTDNSVKIIKNYTKQFSNIKFIHHPNFENKGLSKSINLALKKANGEYIAFLESDDKWDKKYLEEKVDFINKNKQIDLIYNDVKLLGDSKEITNYQKYTEMINNVAKQIDQNQSWAHLFFIFNMIPTFSCVMIKKKTILSCNFNTPIDAFLDWWLWIQVAYNSKIGYINKKLTTWRIHKKSYLNTHEDKTTKNEFLNYSIKLMDKIEPKSTKTILAQAAVFKANFFKLCLTNTACFLNDLKNKPIYFYGAGSFAEEIIEEYEKELNHMNILGFIDNDINKKGQYIADKYQIYSKDDIPNLKPEILIMSLKNWEEAYFELMKEIIQNNLNTKIIPGLFEKLKYKEFFSRTNNDFSIEQL